MKVDFSGHWDPCLHYFEEPQIQILWFLAQTGSVDVLVKKGRGLPVEIPIATHLASAPHPRTNLQASAGGQAFWACPWLASECLTSSCGCPVVSLGPGRYREEAGQKEAEFTGGSQWLFKNKFSQSEVGRWPTVAGRGLVMQILRALSRCLLVMFLMISALLCWCFYYSALWILLWLVCHFHYV